MSVNWFEMHRGQCQNGRTTLSQQLYHQSSPERGQHRGQSPKPGVGAGRSKTKTTTCSRPKGYHLEHNFGHGKQYLSAFLLSLNLLAFLFHTVLEWSDEKYALLRQVLARRQTFFEDIRALTRYMVFESWHHLMDFMIQGLKLESKLALKLGPKLDTS